MSKSGLFALCLIILWFRKFVDQGKPKKLGVVKNCSECVGTCPCNYIKFKWKHTFLWNSESSSVHIFLWCIFCSPAKRKKIHNLLVCVSKYMYEYIIGNIAWHVLGVKYLNFIFSRTLRIIVEAIR